MLGFILTADRDVVQVGVDAVKLFVLHEFHHLPLETGNTISYAKWEAGILKKLVGGFKCGIGSIFCSERNLVVSTSEVNSAKKTILSYVINEIVDAGQRKCVSERKFIYRLRVTNNEAFFTVLIFGHHHLRPPRLGSIIPSASKRFTSLSIKSVSSRLYWRDFVIMG